MFDRLAPRTAAFLLAAIAGSCLAGARPDASAAEPRRQGAAEMMNDLLTGRGPIGGSFTLRDQRGRAAGTADWHGKIVLLYFGYLSCPDACPTDLASIAAAIEALGAAGTGVQPAFVTLDPARDTRALIGRYAESFHPRFVALRGDEAQTRRVATAYKVFYDKILLPGGGYSIDHTSFVYVLDAQGRYAGYFPPGTSGSRIAERLRTMLANAAGQ
jgi:protein SCO1/2